MNAKFHSSPLIERLDSLFISIMQELEFGLLVISGNITTSNSIIPVFTFTNYVYNS
ncbi:MAG: hypothetical protein IPK91_09415 [Saprospiraceae bacterium]|nr:hypothetical protein [Saprospiraceae bacterium]MBK8297476.1 hypothetical protein [Saprospiraceae bacterium]